MYCANEKYVKLTFQRDKENYQEIVALEKEVDSMKMPYIFEKPKYKFPVLWAIFTVIALVANLQPFIRATIGFVGWIAFAVCVVITFLLTVTRKVNLSKDMKNWEDREWEKAAYDKRMNEISDRLSELV